MQTRPFFAFQRFVMAMLFCMLATAAAWSADVTVNYVDENGASESVKNPIELTTSTKTLSGTYYVKDNVSFTESVTMTGNTTIILADGKTLSITPSSGTGIDGNNNYTFTLYGQSLDAATAGTLSISAGSGNGICANDIAFRSGNVNITVSGNFDGLLANHDILIANGNVTVNATKDSSKANAMEANHNITISGGTVNAHTKAGDVISAGNSQNGTVNITGGIVSATTEHKDADGVFADGNITLDYTRPTDRITSDTYHSLNGKVIVVDEKTFYDGSNIYKGNLGYNVNSMQGKTLIPLIAFTGITLTVDGSTITASIDGSPDEISVPCDLTVNSIAYTRCFTVNQASTIMLPFEVAVNNASGAKFYGFTGVKKDPSTNKWTATMTEATEMLAAHKPYLVKKTSSDGTITIAGAVTLKENSNATTTTSVDGWTFKGVYEKKTWTAADCGRDYGFAATSGTSSDGNNTAITAGDFVMVDAGATIRPLRAYLTYTGNAVRAFGEPGDAGLSLPSTISVELVNRGSQLAAISTPEQLMTPLQVKSPTFRYTLDGRPSTGKGLYIENGKKVIKK